jgi:hypothetical protein
MRWIVAEETKAFSEWEICLLSTNEVGRYVGLDRLLAANSLIRRSNIANWV